MDRLKGYPKNFHIMLYAFEDDPVDQELIQSVASAVGFPPEDCRYFMDTNDLDKNINEHVHVCVTDYSLPGSLLNGAEVVRKVKEKNPWAYMIGITGSESRRVTEDFLNAGCFHVANKNDRDFVERLKAYLKEAVERAKADFDFFTWVIKNASIDKTTACHEVSKSG